jgi:phage terminase large subunit
MTEVTRHRVDLPPKVAPLFRPARYKVLRGGRGGAKSWSIARALITLAIKRPLRILCTRELQVSIADSVHRLLEDQIKAIGLGGHFAILKNTIRCRSSGAEFFFCGLRDAEKLKSFEGIDICWVEEAQTVSESSWSLLIPTIRKEGSEIWVSFNPREKRDPTYKRFVENPPPDTINIEIGYGDNPWLPETLRKEMEWAYATDPEAADHVWGGKLRRRSKAQVLAGKYIVEPFEPQPDWHGPYQGIDWGFSVSATALVRLWIVGDEDSLERELYVEREAYGVGVDNDELPELFDTVPNARDYTTRADSARPETISHCNDHGYPLIVGVKKWPGSVADGIAHLRGYKRIVIHPRCKHTVDEAGLWSWKVDKLTGDVLPVLVDAHNHCWDAARYGLEPVICRDGGWCAA